MMWWAWCLVAVFSGAIGFFWGYVLGEIDERQELCRNSSCIPRIKRELAEAKSEIESLKAEAGYYDAQDAMDILKWQNDALISEIKRLKR